MAKPFTLGGGLDPRLSQLERTLDNKLDFRHPTDSTKDIRLALGDDEIEIIQDPFGTPTLIGTIPGGSGSSAWGSITGTLSAQTDLQAALDAKVPTSRTITAGTGLSGGGDLSANRTINLANTTVSPGVYGNSVAQTVSFTVDAQGRITDANSNTIDISAAQVGSGEFPTARIQNDAITDAKLRNSAALSVIGRSANSTGDPGDIAAGTNGHVLRRSGTTLGFGTLASGAFASNTVSRAALVNGTALTVIGRSANSTGAVADISAGSDHQVLRRSGTTLGFGAIALNQANAVTGQLPAANVATGTSGAAIPLLNGANTHSGLATFTGGTYMNGGARHKAEFISSSTTLGTTQNYIVTDTPGITLTLPSSADVGRTYHIRNMGGGNITIARNGGTINELGSDITLATGAAVKLVAFTSNSWYSF